MATPLGRLEATGHGAIGQDDVVRTHDVVDRLGDGHRATLLDRGHLVDGVEQAIHTDEDAVDAGLKDAESCVGCVVAHVCWGERLLGQDGLRPDKDGTTHTPGLLDVEAVLGSTLVSHVVSHV